MCFCYDSHSVFFPVLEKRKAKLVKEIVLDAMEETLTIIIKKEKDFTRDEGNKKLLLLFLTGRKHLHTLVIFDFVSQTLYFTILKHFTYQGLSEESTNRLHWYV